MASGKSIDEKFAMRAAAEPALSMLLGVALMLTQCVCGSNNRPTETEQGGPHPTGATAPSPEGRGEVPDSTLTVAGNGPGAATTPGPTPGLKLPAGLDTKDLDDSEKRLLQEVLEDQYDPCGKPRSFLESLGAKDSCDEAKKLSVLAVQAIATGLSKKQVVQELLKEQARWASKTDFELADSPHHGEPGPGKKVIVEFFDYQCPHCKLASKPAKEMAERAGAVLYYKMLPLAIHPIAREAALVSLAAQRQGKFFAVHELFFDNQERLSSELIRTLAQQAGLDMVRLDADLKDPTLAAQLARDLAESVRAYIDGTPTFFVDGYRVEFEELEAALK